MIHILYCFMQNELPFGLQDGTVAEGGGARRAWRAREERKVCHMRTFIALELPEAFRHEVAGLSRCLRDGVKGRFVPPENYHLTVAFLGDVDEHDVRLAMDAMDEACAQVEAVPVECAGLGKFGRSHDATLWLGLREADELMKLTEAVRMGLGERGVPFDAKAFKPHITLARRASLPKGSFADLPFPAPAHTEAVTLFKSELNAQGATYTPLFSCALPRLR